MKKKPKEEFIDDGRVVADMAGLGGRITSEVREKRAKFAALKMTGKESRAMLKGLYLALLPIIVFFILGFIAMFLIVYIWIN